MKSPQFVELPGGSTALIMVAEVTHTTRRHTEKEDKTINTDYPVAFPYTLLTHLLNMKVT